MKTLDTQRLLIRPFEMGDMDAIQDAAVTPSQRPFSASSAPLR